MQAPSALVRLLFAWLGPTSVHWAAGRWRRALAWDVAIVAAMFSIIYLTPWPLFAVTVAQIVDGAIIRPARARSTGGYAIAMLIAGCVSFLVAVTLRATWVEAFSIPAGSMVPALEVGDHIFVDK